MSSTLAKTSRARARDAKGSENKKAFLDSRFRGFSCPQEDLDEDFLKLVAATYAREITRLFLDRHGAEIASRGDGLVELLVNWLNQDLGFETVWDPAVSKILRTIQVGEATEPINHAAALALRVSASGLSGEWSLALSKPVRLHWGRWLLPTADRIAVTCDGKGACVRTCLSDANHKANFTCTDDEWETDEAEAMPQFGIQHQKIALLPPASALSAEVLGAFDAPSPRVKDVPPEMIGDCHETITLLTEFSPIYLQWILRVLRYVIPLHETDDIQSGSAADEFGLISVSVGLKAATLAESFVHEASHQYLNLLCRLGPIDDGTDTDLYYSPVMRSERPLGRIVVAYHAFANILLLYRLFRANSIADDYCARREAELVSYVEQLESPLRSNQALTSIGRGLCNPLIERLH